MCRREATLCLRRHRHGQAGKGGGCMGRPQSRPGLAWEPSLHPNSFPQGLVGAVCSVRGRRKRQAFPVPGERLLCSSPPFGSWREAGAHENGSLTCLCISAQKFLHFEMDGGMSVGGSDGGRWPSHLPQPAFPTTQPPFPPLCWQAFIFFPSLWSVMTVVVTMCGVV